MESSEEVPSSLSVDELFSRKDSIELELKKHFATLDEQGGVGLKGALVDKEGFPRADIDIYAVRTARNRIICLQNDYKMVMRHVEEKLHMLHAQSHGVAVSADSLDLQQLHRKQETSLGTEQGFVKVTEVTHGSPAAQAGLMVGDLVLEFGTIKKEQFSNLQDIAAVVQHSQNSSIRLVISRGEVVITISLKPQKWAGRGLLGCAVVPV